MTRRKRRVLFLHANIRDIGTTLILLTCSRCRLLCSRDRGVDLKNRIILLLTAAVIPIACQVAIAGSKPPEPDMAKCVASARVWDLTVGVSLDRMPALFCQRIFEGVRTGRISFSDLNAIQFNQPTEIWSVIKGKPRAAAVTRAPAPQSSRYRNCTGIDGAFQVPISQRCPFSGYAHGDQPTKADTRRSSKPASAPRSTKYRNCTGIDGTFQVPISQKCPLSGYAHY
ncbi:conserved hypothetical protein [Mesorhizobium sp. SOD10]|nr:conserved hypothetical protein [Mesorhizobium sp. SOD10]